MTSDKNDELPSKYHFGIAKSTDAQKIAHLHALSWQRHYRGVLPDHYLDHEAVSERTAVWEDRFATPDPTMRVITLYHENDFIGFSGFFLDQHDTLGTYIDNLHVLEEHQGRGLGHQLLQRTAQVVQSEGHLKSMYLHVFKANTSAIGFYERKGGKAVAEQMMDCPGGVKRLVIDYAWSDLDVLAGMN